MSKEILINRMYSGDYLTTGNNIGHEVINLFRCDNGHNYIYVLSDGSVAKKHNGRIDVLLLVRWIGNRTMEILAKAVSLKQVLSRKSSGRGDRKDLHEEQIKYIIENKITYGGVRLDKLFKDNIYQGEIDYESFFVTYEAGSIIKPLRPIFITDKEVDPLQPNTFRLEGITFSTQSPKMYYPEGTPAYLTLDAIINDDSLWEAENTTEIIQASRYDTDDNHNFLKIIRKEYDELVFSNLLAHYFLQSADMFGDFCREVLGIDNIDKNYTIERESQDNIDLLIQDSDNVIVIENKIKSGINGIRHDVYSDEIQSQLCKYFDFANEIAKGRKVSCFIFSPDYNYLDIRNHKASQYYRVIRYSELYRFFIKQEKTVFDKYFEDFLKAIHKHTLMVDSELFEEMRRRFAARIIEVNLSANKESEV